MIGGTKREKPEFEKVPLYVGLSEVKVVAVNPDVDQYIMLTGREDVKEDSKKFEYLGESKEDNTYLRVDFWLEEIKEREREGEKVNELFRLTYFIEDKERENKDGSKRQYINNVGVTAWAEDENSLPKWFLDIERDYKVAKRGEEELYNFMRMWLSNLDYRNKETTLQLDWKKLMKGNVKELRDQIGGEWANNVIVLLTVEVTEKEGKIYEYQKIHPNNFLHPYNLKYFNVVDYTKAENLKKLKNKKPKDLKPYERFITNVTHEEYGEKNFFLLRETKEYDATENVAGGDKVLTETGSDY